MIESQHQDQYFSLDQENDAETRNEKKRLAIKRIESFIDGLSNLNELDKYWARKDALEQLEQDGENPGVVQKLEKKYSFYDKAGALRNEICKKAPDGNGNTVCNLIDTSILNVSSEGSDRSWKLKELEEIKTSVDSWKKEQNITSFIQRKEEMKDSVVAKVLMLFDSEFAEQFKTFQTEMGAPRFWAFTRSMSPAEFPNFTTTFNFRVPRDFLKSITRANLKDWPGKLRKALLLDAQEMLASEVFDKNRSQEIARLKTSKTVADFVASLLELKKFRDIERLRIDRKKEIEEREKAKLKEKASEEEKKKLKQEEKKKKGAEKNKIEEEKKEQKQKEEERKKQEKDEGSVDLGAEKTKILEFYDKSIEHAEKVKEECANWGVRPDDIEYWGQEGVKNRMNLLKKRGRWNDYVKFNSNDKYIPSTAQGNGFRFRWLNVNTGSRISAASADSGIKYMRRYKESGYQLCVLAGAFSIDWAGSDSIIDTPVRFLEKMKSLKANLLGKSATK